MKQTSRRRMRGGARELAYLALAVSLITVCAWITVPFGPIPVTLQTLAVALAGGVLGWKRGVAAVFVYILMGLCGIPVFSGFQATGALFSATGGYLFGFLFTALLAGLANHVHVQKTWIRILIFFTFMAIGEAICYFFGTVWFVYLNGCEAGYALSVCVLPFILPDLLKFAFAAPLAVRLGRLIRRN